MPPDLPPQALASEGEVSAESLSLPAEAAPAPSTWRARLLPYTGLLAVLVIWTLATELPDKTLIPGPLGTLKGLGTIIGNGVVFRYLVASLFRVTWGYGLAVIIAVPLGLIFGWSRRAELAVNPLLQMLRPISPLAWIPIAILGFGVGDVSAIFIIFLGSFFPLVVAAMNSVSNVSATHINIGRNFGMSSLQILRRIVFPAVLPQLIVGMRLALGVAWLVIVAAEMIAVNSGLGFLIVEARNAGNRYDLVLSGMLLIGSIGLGLDVAMRRLERVKDLKWSYAVNAPTETIRHVERRRHAR